jgi:hypothetical protein
MRSSPDVMHPVEPCDNYIYFLNPLARAPSPDTITIAGRHLVRFMDFIYLPCPVEELTSQQVITVNRLRRRLVQHHQITVANEKVKNRFAQVIRRVAAASVFEWGCGYWPIQPYLSKNVLYAATDLDPDVVSYQSRQHRICYWTNDLVRSPPSTRYAAIVSIFVFHFNLPDEHIATMNELLGPKGFILANVYHRTERSRRRLRAAFNAYGITAEVRIDSHQLCKRHEYWVMHRNMHTETLGLLLQGL